MPGKIFADMAYRERNYRCIAPRDYPEKITVPANVEIREHHVPCFRCGAREGCRHRRLV